MKNSTGYTGSVNKTDYQYKVGYGRQDSLSPSFGSSVRFRWPHLTAETQQFIHTVTAEALTLPLGDM